MNLTYSKILFRIWPLAHNIGNCSVKIQTAFWFSKFILVINSFLLPILIVSLCGLIISKYGEFVKESIGYSNQYISDDLYIESILLLPYNLFLFVLSIVGIINSINNNPIMTYTISLLLPISGLILGIQTINETQDNEKYVHIYRMSITVLAFSIFLILNIIIDIKLGKYVIKITNKNKKVF